MPTGAQRWLVDQLVTFQRRASEELLPLADIRRLFLETAKGWNQGSPTDVRIEGYVYDGAFGATEIIFFRPPDAAARQATLCYLHGGGFVLGSPRSTQLLTALLAARSGWTVASIDYRLSPDHQYPVPLDHTIEAIRHMAHHASKLGLDPEAFALGGDSAGANLALGSARTLHGELSLRALLLLNPALLPDSDAECRTAFARPEFAQRLGDSDMIWKHYLGDTPRDNPRAVPMLGDLAGLPPTYVATAGIDIFLIDAQTAAHLLIEAGVTTSYRLYRDSIHSFMALGDKCPIADRAISEAATFLRSAGSLS